MPPTVLQFRRKTSEPARRSGASRLGRLAAAIASVFRPGCRRIGPDDLKRHDLPVCTQRIGVRFSERLRDVFRLRWLKTRP